MLDRDSSADCAAAATVDPSHIVLFLSMLALGDGGLDGRVNCLRTIRVEAGILTPVGGP